MTDIRPIFYTSLRAALEERGMTQSDLSRAMGKVDVYIGTKLSKNYDLRLNTAQAIAEALHKPLHSMLVPTQRPAAPDTLGKTISLLNDNPHIANTALTILTALIKTQ